MTIDIKEIKIKLEEEKTRLESGLSTVARKNPDNPTDWEAIPADDEKLPADENLLAEKISDYEDNNAVVNELEPRYLDVKEALDRIEAGTFGFCEVCQKPIDDERLTANPAARTCREHMN